MAAGDSQRDESHNLYGQLMGETGTLGGVAFASILVCFVVNLRAIRKVRKAHPEWANDLIFQLPKAIGVAVFLLLLMGVFGHNLFRFSWLWYGGFVIIARHCVVRRAATWEPEEEEWEEEEEVPEGWVVHPAHAVG